MSAATRKRPILIVDDESEMLSSVNRLLRLDFEVFTASSGAEAIEILQKHVIHVVITDHRMPQMTGVEFLCRARMEHPEAIRLIFTGYADANAVIDAINHGGVYRYIAKPFDPHGLAALLHEAGAQYDRIVERRQLLADLRAHEEKYLAFSDEMRARHGGTLNPDIAAGMDQLRQSSQELLIRLEKMLTEPESRPV